jgi:hypothetical protein
MSQTPEYPHGAGGHPGSGGEAGSGGQPPADLGAAEVLDSGPGGTAAGRGTRRGAVIGAGVLAAALVGGGVTVAASKLSGGGAQPDEAVPASAVGLVVVDADPSSGQKVELLKFLRKFPDAKKSLGAVDDPAKALFDSLRKDGTLTGDYATDVKPWLGDRAAVAVLPAAAAEGDGPQMLLVLSVKDRDKARAGIKKITEGKGSCELTDDFAVCAEQARTAKQAVTDAAKSPLADLKSYRDDLSGLGDQGVARAWVDLARAAPLAPALAGRGSAAASATVKGRAVMALRFGDGDLELAGALTGTGASKITGTVKADALPADAVAVLGLAGSDQVVQQIWDGVVKYAERADKVAELTGQVQRFQDQYGIRLPQDLRAAVGGQTAVVLGASDGLAGGPPGVAVRVAGERSAIDKVVKAGEGRLPFIVARAEAGSDTVLASTPGFARSVAGGSGLATAQAFTKAVPGAGDAQVILFLDAARGLSTFGGQLNLPPGVRANLDPVSAVGISARQDGDRTTFSVRVTTR